MGGLLQNIGSFSQSASSPGIPKVWFLPAPCEFFRKSSSFDFSDALELSRLSMANY